MSYGGGDGSGRVPEDIRSRGQLTGYGGRARIGEAGAPGALQPLPVVVQIPPPELAVYPAASLLYAFGSQAAIANGTSVAVAPLVIAGGNVGVINSWIIFGVNLVVGLQATFTLRINGAPVPGSTRALTPQNAAAASLAWGPEEILFRVPEAGTADVLISVTAGGPAELGAQIGGWEYPFTVQDRYGAAWRT